MTAEHEDADGVDGVEGADGTGDAAEYDGMDALMAAITETPLPAAARLDASFLARHRAAEADVAVLRRELTWIAEALTGEALTADEPAGDEPAGEGPARERTVASGSGGRPRGTPRPTAPARPARPPRPGRPTGRRRALRIALGSLAGAAALGMVAGLGWLAARPGGGAGTGGSAADAKSADQGAAEVSGDDGRPSDPASALACYRLVAEGTVAKVERLPQDPWTRIVLTVTRSYEPARGPAEVGFVLDGGASPAPREGQHVLVGVGRGRDTASLWAVGDARVAVNRAWITETLPEARHTTCPQDGEPTGKP